MQENFRVWLPVILWVLLMMVLQFIGPDVLRYQTRAIHEGEVWRILSGHWVHANWIHFVLNMAGFFICRGLTGVSWTMAGWSWRIMTLGLGISLLFLLLNPNIGWYVGFSGVLFGLYVMSAVDAINRFRFISVTLLLLITAKMTIDLTSSGKMTSSELIGVPVLIESHLYGVVMALAIMGSQVLYRILFLKNNEVT